jgi:protocatechuate 3,4-dioxygenase beta subunit
MSRAIATLFVLASVALIGRAATHEQPTGQITGRVLRSDDGSPVTKAEVTLASEDEPTLRALGGERIARTGADGVFTFREILAGSYTVRASRSGFVAATGRVTLGPAQTAATLDLRVVAAGVIAGTIVDEDGDPVAHLEVDAIAIDFLPGDRRQLQLRARATTDDLGGFRIADLTPGTYVVRAGGLLNYPRQSVPLKHGANGGLQYRDTYHPGTPRVEEAERIDLAPGVERRLRLAVGTENVYSVSGVVTNVPQGPQPEVQWERPTDAEQMWCERCSVTIERDGSFKIPRVPPGDYTLRAVAIDRQQGRSNNVGYGRAQIVNADVQTTIEAGRAAEVHGALTPPDVVRETRVLVFLQSRGMPIYPAIIGSEGRFDIQSIPPGEYKFSVRGIGPNSPTSLYIKRATCGGSDYAMEPLALDLGATLGCEVTLGTDTVDISGRVTDTDAAGDVVVVIIPQSLALRRIPRYTLSTTAAHGQYKLVGVVPGSYYVFAVPARQDHAYFAIDFADLHRSRATRVDVSAGAPIVVDLRPLRASEI